MLGKWLPNSCNVAASPNGVFYEVKNNTLVQKVISNNQVIQFVHFMQISRVDPEKNVFKLEGIEVDPIAKTTGSYSSTRDFTNTSFNVIEIVRDGKLLVKDGIELETNKPRDPYVKCNANVDDSSDSQAKKNQKAIAELLAIASKLAPAQQQSSGNGRAGWNVQAYGNNGYSVTGVTRLRSDPGGTADFKIDFSGPRGSGTRTITCGRGQSSFSTTNYSANCYQ
jgi:hypothetical protein